MKKLIVLGSFLVLVSTSSVGFAFNDVPTSHRFKTAIDFLQQNEIVQGYDDGEFKPDRHLNRAELLKIVIKGAIGPVPEVSGQKCFDDVELSAWYAPYVCYAKSVGIVKGYEDGTFRPSQNIKVAEALKISMVANGMSYSESQNPWYSNLVNVAKERQLISDEIDNNWSLDINRGQMADLITRVTKFEDGTLTDYIFNVATEPELDSEPIVQSESPKTVNPAPTATPIATPTPAPTPIVAPIPQFTSFASTNRVLSSQQYEIIDKVTIDPVLSYIDEPIQLTFTIRPEYSSKIEKAEVRIWQSKLNAVVKIPVNIQKNSLSVTISPNQKQSFDRQSDVRLLLTIDGQEVWPSNFNASFEIFPFAKSDMYVYDSANVTVVGPKGYEKVLQNIAYEDELCYAIARNYFGKPLPLERLYVYNQIKASKGVATAGLVQVINFLDPNTIEIYKTAKTSCEKTTLHEIIHVYLSTLPVPGWMNEGLAETLSQRLTQNLPGYIDEKLVCQNAGWTTFSSSEVKSYLVMDGSGVTPQSEDYYATPRCYLKYLEEKSSINAEKMIIDRMSMYKNNGISKDIWCSSGYKSYLREILVPVFGDDIVSTSINRFGIKDYSCS